MQSIFWYLKNMFRPEWITKFFYVKTAPLVTPISFRDFPHVTDKRCSHCFSCMMVCPAPGAIEVIQEGEEWHPVIHKGHCIRCGMCVEICPDLVLDSGQVHQKCARDETFMQFSFHIDVDTDKCMGCGNCAVSCPINKEIDEELGHSGFASSDEVIIKVVEGKAVVLNPEKCTGCKTCEKGCSNGAIKVARVLESLQVKPQ